MERPGVIEQTTGTLASQIDDIAYRLESSDDLDPLIERIGDARYVFLGGASHGTSEFYTWRSLISQRLILEKDFSFIAVEGDWPECYHVNRHIKGYDKSGSKIHDVLHTFKRWPTWLWANWEVATLLEWLQQYNRDHPYKIGFYGLDIYSLWESMEAIIDYLQQNYPDAVQDAKRAYMCFEPYGKSPDKYAQFTAFLPETCEHEVVRLLARIRQQIEPFSDDEAAFSAEQNALVAVNAERYYRAMVTGGVDTWNIRDRHMMETLDRLMTLYGPASKSIVWAHNSHVGDARATDMAQAGMVSIGQIAREQHQPDEVILVGFSSHHGTVIAANEWGARMEHMRVPPGRSDTWEDVLHLGKRKDKLLILDQARSAEAFQERGHRAIGVVYSPQWEHFGNYVPTILPERYDAMLYLDETQALHPLHIPPEKTEPPEMYPWGL